MRINLQPMQLFRSSRHTNFLTTPRQNRKHLSKTSIAFDTNPVFNTTALLPSRFTVGRQKTYIDPTTYDNPQRALLDFAREIDASCIVVASTIGGGEFGDVCRGYLRSLNGATKQEVAIKTLKSGSSPEQKLDFLSEASIMGQFNHPNVIRLEGVVTKSLPLMIITEYMENKSLEHFLRDHDGEFTVVELVEMLRDVAAGMNYLSEMGYVHRDLAARNILVNKRLICKVSDFGLSRVLEDDDNSTYTAKGSKIPIRWTAPEAITYQKFTSASDVWSYGIVMWEVMSYGERPYWGMSNHDVIVAVDSGYRLPAPMDCPVVQHQLMLKCWKKDRSDRPKFSSIFISIDRMLKDLSELETGPSLRSHSASLRNDGYASFDLLQSCHGLSLYNKKTMCSKTLPHDGHESKIPLSCLGTWLQSIGLEKYKKNFLVKGFFTKEQISQISEADLNYLEITNFEDKSILLKSVFALKSNTSSCNKNCYKLMLEDNLIGIPV